MISNCGSDERGRFTGGTAGDQTGREWEIRDWYRYSGGWVYMIRHPDPKVGEMIASLAVEAAKNDLIGYDQNERYTFWQRLQEAGYHPSKIKTACEADCSSGCAALAKATGYLMGLTKLQGISIYAYTGNIKDVLQQAGFNVYTDSKYLSSDAYLLPGDFLLKPGWHICTNLNRGSKAVEPTPSQVWNAKGTATCTDNGVNVRSTAGGPIIGQVHQGNRFEVDGKKSGKWVHVNVAGIGIGYIYDEYVVYDVAWKATGTATSTANGVNVRSTPTDASSVNILGQVHMGNRFEVDGQKSNGWIHVKVAGIGIGWIYQAWVKYD